VAKHRRTTDLFGIPLWVVVLILVAFGLIASLFSGVVGWALGLLAGFFMRWVF
jgi:hypothetical protein